MPAEICNIPAIASHVAPNNPTGTRNDFVRQVVGSLDDARKCVFGVDGRAGRSEESREALTTERFESGDNVLAEVRLRFVVERYLDPGADGIYGNSAKPGTDNVVGSFDDPGKREDATYDINHPFQPRYLYRVISSEEIR